MMHLFSVTQNGKEIWVVAPDKASAIAKATMYYERLGKTVKTAHLYVRQLTYQRKPTRVDGFHREGDKLLLTLIVDDVNAGLDDIRFGSFDE